MASFMAPFPRFFFCYVEPALITYSAISYTLNPGMYTASLLSGSHPPTVTLATERLASLNQAYISFLAGLLVAIIMWTSDNRRTVHLTVVALILSDLPHWAAVLAVTPLDFANWSPGMKGHMLGPIVTAAVKAAYLAGWLGDDAPSKGKTQ